MARLPVLALPGLCLLLGCVQMQVTPLSGLPVPAKAPGCDIQVMADMPRDRRYQELALIDANSPWDLQTLLPKLKERACALGADALVVKRSTLATGHHPAQVSVVAIRFL